MVNILFKKIQDTEINKIFLYQFLHWAAHLDLDRESVADLNAGIFSCLWDDRAFKMRIREGFQHRAVV